MTKRDYELIVRALKAIDGLLDQADLNLIVLSMCKELKADNPGFKPDKFVKACGADTSVLLAV
jgi:hypothetical protein